MFKGRPPFSVRCPICRHVWIPRKRTKGKPSRCPACFRMVLLAKARTQHSE